jgi:hypothetical protein
MYEDDDDRMDAAEQLARLDPRAGAEAFRAIAGYEGADNEQRIDAAEQLARLDRRAAAEAFRAIACDESVDDGLRVAGRGFESCRARRPESHVKALLISQAHRSSARC